MSARGRPLVLVDATTLRTTAGRRGIGRVAFDLLHALEATRDEWRDALDVAAVTALSPARGWTIRRDLAAAADETVRFAGTARGELPHLRRLLLGPAARAAGAALVHLPEPNGSPAALAVPFTATCHDLIPLRMPDAYLNGRRGRRLAKELVRWWRPRRVVAISDRTRRDLVEVLGLPASRIDLVPNGLDLAWLGPRERDDDDARRARLGVGARPYLVYAGYCDARRNVETMLDALAHARRTVDVELAWAGDLTPWRGIDRVRALVAERGLDAHVRLLGFVSDADLSALYRGARALLFLSRLEGFGYPVAEAMACGCPVVVARGSGSDGLAGDAAIVVDPDDAAAAGDGAASLVAGGPARDRLVRDGLARAAALGRDEMARGYVRAWARALAIDAPLVAARETPGGAACASS